MFVFEFSKFLRLYTKSKIYKEIIAKLDFIKFRTFAVQKNTRKRMKRQGTVQEKMLVKHVLGKGLR